MSNILFSRLGFIIGCMAITAIYLLARTIIVAWRDTNGNGQIDAGE